MARNESLLNPGQLQALRAVLRQGAAEASSALSKWLGRAATVSIDTVQQLPLRHATTLLGEGDEPIRFCSTEMTGRLTGELILTFDDASGLAVADLILDRPRGTASAWQELEESAALETTNILCCAYLNALARRLPAFAEEPAELLPTPPRLGRDFAQSLIESALLGQALTSDHVLVAQTEFHVDREPVNWTLLFVPDGESLERLRRWLR